MWVYLRFEKRARVLTMHQLAWPVRSKKSFAYAGTLSWPRLFDRARTIIKSRHTRRPLKEPPLPQSILTFATTLWKWLLWKYSFQVILLTYKRTIGKTSHYYYILILIILICVPVCVCVLIFIIHKCSYIRYMNIINFLIKQSVKISSFFIVYRSI